MSGLCGWLATVRTNDAASALLDKMAEVFPQGGARRVVKQDRQAEFGMALRAHPKESAWNEEERLCAAVIGYPRWSQESLRSLAHDHGHAAALLEAYRRYGRDLLDHLHGHFVFAVFDLERNLAFCAIDRLGVYRLCYAVPRQGQFLFSTSADSLRAYPGMGATITPQTLYQYLFFIDRVAAPATIYEEQRKLRPGEAVVFEAGEVKCWRYWRLEYDGATGHTRSEHHQALREKLDQAISRCLEKENEEKVASFLSGGLDSSTVAGLLARATAGKGHCVTIAFQHADFDETKYAEIAARHFGLKHDVFMVGPEEVLAVLPKLCQIYDEPYSNSSVIPCFYCAKIGQEFGNEVILAGDGGDELFAGNTRYLKDDIFEHYQKIPSVVRRHLLESILPRMPFREKISLLRRANNYVKLAKQSVAYRLTADNVFFRVSADRVFSADAFATLDLKAPTRFAEALYDSACGGSKIQKMMHVDLQLTLADSDLRKVLTTCTAAGIRVRFPMLDDDLAEFSGTLPPELLVEGGDVRAFYKEALIDFLPTAIIEKEKQGFGLPMFQYIAELPALASFFCDALHDLKRRPFFRPAFLEELINEIRQGRPESYTGIAWDLAVLETWMTSRKI